MAKLRKFRPPRKKLTEEDIKSRLRNIYQSRGNYVEHIQTIRSQGLHPLIATLCHTTAENDIKMCQEQIAYFDEAIAWYKAQLKENISITDLLG